MTAILIDTDVLSFIFKGDSRAVAYAPHLDGCLLVISFMTVAELDRWALGRSWGRERRALLEEYLKNFVVHPFDRDLCRHWAEVSDDARRRRGREINCNDAWIAATAVAHEIPLVTHNARHFADIRDLRVISEPAA